MMPCAVVDGTIRAIHIDVVRRRGGDLLDIPLPTTQLVGRAEGESLVVCRVHRASEEWEIATEVVGRETHPEGDREWGRGAKLQVSRFTQRNVVGVGHCSTRGAGIGCGAIMQRLTDLAGHKSRRSYRSTIVAPAGSI